jgi:uncharacterized low-complexity protein
MKKTNKTPFAAAMGTAFLSTFAATAANAETNPFAMTDMNNGYMQVAEASKSGEAMPGMKEGSCGEGKCGGAMQSAPKTVEGACAGNKPAPKAAGKATEGKCGEGMCGAMMEGGKMKKGMENMCGAMMKGKEGACGAMQKGEKGAGQEKVSPKDAAGE